MPTAPALLDLQRSFIAALYGEDAPDLAGKIAGNGLPPSSRLQIYRNSSEQIHVDALRTSYPAILALVGEDFFEQAAAGYRRASASRSGNLHEFGAHFAEFLEQLPQTAHLPYLGDVARLEWRRQLSALSAEANPLSPVEFERALNDLVGPARIVLHPSLQLFSSTHPALAIWMYAINPDQERFELPSDGENIVLWRTDGEVAMASVDAASHACIEALVRGLDLNAAHVIAHAHDADFDFIACIMGLLARNLVVAAIPLD